MHVVYVCMHICTYFIVYIIIFHIADTANSFTISRQLFLPTTTSNDSDLLSNKTTCDDDSMCCTSDQCNYSIRDQVKHFINMGNLYR